MKLLLFSDLHCDAAAAQQLVQAAGDVDVVIGAGDFATCRKNIHTTLDVLEHIETPSVLVPGNAESFEELQQATVNWEPAHVLHGNGVTIDGVSFWGLGGAVPETPFGDWSYDLSEEQAVERLAGCPSGGVLVTHSPPKGIVDTNAEGKSLGSEAVRQTIREKQPRLVVCGHIHACWGETGRLGETFIVNAGPKGIEFSL